MIEKLQGERIIPEKALNLELKYLDENVRPFLLQMDQSYANHILGGPAAPILAFANVAINATIRINRLTVEEVRVLREGFAAARGKMSMAGAVGDGFGGAIQDAMDKLNWKIADIYMFAQPIKQQKESAIGAMLKELLKQEQTETKAKV